MTDMIKDANILSNKVFELVKQRDCALKNITEQIQRLMIERDKISEPYTKQIEDLKNEYLDKYLKDSKGNPIRVKDVIINNNTGNKFGVIDRYQQIILSYLGNPRIEVKKYNKNGELKGIIISLYPSDLKNYTKID